MVDVHAVQQGRHGAARVAGAVQSAGAVGVGQGQLAVEGAHLLTGQTQGRDLRHGVTVQGQDAADAGGAVHHQQQQEVRLLLLVIVVSGGLGGVLVHAHHQHRLHIAAGIPAAVVVGQ